MLTLLFAVALHSDPRVDQLLAKMTLEEKVGQLTQVVEDQLPNPLAGAILSSSGAAHINELQRGRKIPLLIGSDVIHGYRTIFPIPLAIASSWDPQMAELSARIAAREAHSDGIHWTFAPMVDIARDARWGRIAEGAGEDPVLGAAMAAAYVRGFQGPSPGLRPPSPRSAGRGPLETSMARTLLPAGGAQVPAGRVRAILACGTH